MMEECSINRFPLLVESHEGGYDGKISIRNNVNGKEKETGVESNDAPSENTAINQEHVLSSSTQNERSKCSSSSSPPPSSPNQGGELYYDLRLTIEDGGEDNDLHYDESIMMEEDHHQHFPLLPILNSYWNIIKYFFLFSRWLLLVILLNSVVVLLSIRKGYFKQNYGFDEDGRWYSEVYWPFYSWMGVVLSLSLIGTSFWFYWAAKIVKRDIEYLDHVAQYEHPPASDNGNGGINLSNCSSFGTSEQNIAASRQNESFQEFIRNSDHIYGRLSRRVDTFLSAKTKTKLISTSVHQHRSSSGGTNGQQQERPQESKSKKNSYSSSRSSSFVNLSYTLWAIFLTAGIYGLSGNVGALFFTNEWEEDTNDYSSVNNRNNGNFFQNEWEDDAIYHSSTNDRNNGNNSTEVFKNNLEKYPYDVQEWITKDAGNDAFFDEIGDEINVEIFDEGYMIDENYDDDAQQQGSDDDYYKSMNSNDQYKFPTVEMHDKDLIAVMNDGTLYFAAKENKVENSKNDKNAHRHYYHGNVVLAEVKEARNNDNDDGKGGLSIIINYHHDTILPSMFIPVESTIMVNNSSDSNEQNNNNESNRTMSASQYCFVSRNIKNREVYINNMIMNCIVTDLIGNPGKTHSILQNEIKWKDPRSMNKNDEPSNIEDIKYTLLNAASSGNSVLIRLTNYDAHQVQEVDPLTMEMKLVYYYVFPDKIKYMNRHVKLISKTLAFLTMILFTPYWLIKREGEPSGVIPFILATVYILTHFFRDDYQEELEFNLSLVIGTVMFHILLWNDKKKSSGSSNGSSSNTSQYESVGDDRWRCSCSCRHRRFLPSWIGADLIALALYSWILGFLLIGQLSIDCNYCGSGWIWALVCLILTGIILNHPVLHLIGYTLIITAMILSVIFLILFIQDDYFDTDDFVDGFIMIIGLLLTSLGVIRIANIITRNKKFVTSCCRSCLRCCCRRCLLS